MMTSVLRDSLGGNCKTVMIATVNAEAVSERAGNIGDLVNGDVTGLSRNPYRTNPEEIIGGVWETEWMRGRMAVPKQRPCRLPAQLDVVHAPALQSLPKQHHYWRHTYMPTELFRYYFFPGANGRVDIHVSFRSASVNYQERRQG